MLFMLAKVLGIVLASCSPPELSIGQVRSTVSTPNLYSLSPPGSCDCFIPLTVQEPILRKQARPTGLPVDPMCSPSKSPSELVPCLHGDHQDNITSKTDPGSQ